MSKDELNYGKEIAKKRDEWFATEEALSCLETPIGAGHTKYLKNRLERAFLAGVQAAEDIANEARLIKCENCGALKDKDALYCPSCLKA